MSHQAKNAARQVHMLRQQSERAALQEQKAQQWRLWDCPEVAPVDHTVRREIEDRRLALQLGITLAELRGTVK